ncbi:hypothetical protein J7384_17640 [Endozoicomonas sp. G2_1]|uniref:DUF6440 family protein n=1 Tax=Endozoicomonas sp. G2_1 TaxID=2821091 RepID=UPI001ADB6BEC|nr:DUF6440 family protein [Endozoicomonas sp. G2_1]MBO9492188.1 hypothetical protein [Endozoicomonas sp. G2_1]
MNQEQAIDLIQKGVHKGLNRHILFFSWIFLALLAFQFGYNFFGFGMNSTDGPNQRSNMVVRVDHQTGCQYLESARGGLTPRVDIKGNHLGCTQSMAAEVSGFGGVQTTN